ncbi:MAG: flagellar biosynthesis protein FlhA [Spirochaetota bacterium]|nr:flagellar biosynthesis protein FlhA [Spirochaetota bacterium]
MAKAQKEKPTFINSWMQKSDILIAIGVVVIIGMLIIPIPTFLLDVAIAINLAISLGILLIVMYVSRGSEFSVFPSLLLVTTIFRLAINISSTRLILLEGQKFDGKIIKAFGDFVVQNNYIVGMIVFLMLIAVQFIVIIKGATRVSEVAARFTLDAMPGKQMSIDADLNAGLITEEEAVRRRKELREEVDFYGAMDGASKFVQGDVRVGLLITLINIVGGIIIGTTMHNQTLAAAFKTFFTFAVGDGLSAQIPSLLLSTATGIIVTRAVSDQSLGKDIVKQMNLKPMAIMITGGFLLFLSFLPGFPWKVLIPMGIAVLAYGYYLKKTVEKEKVDEADRIKKAEKPAGPENVIGLINVEPIEIEIGFNLVPFVDVEQGGDLLDRVKLIRKTCALDLGLLVPPIRIRDNMKLRPSDYSIKIKGVEVGKGSLRVKKFLSIPSISVTEEIEGEDTLEPAFKTKAKWINEEDREKAESLGYSVVDPPSIVATHLTEAIKRNSKDILGRQEVKQLLDNVKETYPAVVDEALKATNLGTIQKVLQHLLNDQISIRNMVTILEVIADYGEKILNIDLLTEYVRQHLAKQISHQYMDDDDVIRAYTIDPDLERILEESLQETDEGYISTLDPNTMGKVIERMGAEMRRVSELGYQFVVLCSSSIRGLVRKITERNLPNLTVLSYNEIIPQVTVEQLGIISIND